MHRGESVCLPSAYDDLSCEEEVMGVDDESDPTPVAYHLDGHHHVGSSPIPRYQLVCSHGSVL